MISLPNAVTGLHDMDEFVQSQLILAVSVSTFLVIIQPIKIHI